MIETLAYAADAAILGTYARTLIGRSVHAFHVANALGAPPVIASEVIVGAWPAMILTVAFGLVGLVGWVRDE